MYQVGTCHKLEQQKILHSSRFSIHEPYQPTLSTIHCFHVSKTLVQSNPCFFLEPHDETFHGETGFCHTFWFQKEKLSKMIRNLPKVTDLSPFFDNCDLLWCLVCLMGWRLNLVETSSVWTIRANGHREQVEKWGQIWLFCWNYANVHDLRIWAEVNSLVVTL